MEKQEKLKPHLKQKDIKVYRDALEKHSWDVNEAFNELFLKGEVKVKNREQRCQVIRNFEIIKECFEPINVAQSNMTLLTLQASSTILTGGNENENLKIGGMEEAGSCEQQHVLAEEIDALLSPEHRDFVSHELQTMMSNLSSQLASFLPALEPDRAENSQVKGIQITTGDTRLMGPEAKFKWSHFETALKVIQEMFCREPSIELADDVDYIVDTKIIKGTYDFSQDESVNRFKEKVLQYTQLVRDLFRNDHQTRKEQLQKEIESEVESMKIIFETESDKIEQKINFLDKAGSTVDTKLLLIKQDLEKTIEQKKRLECELATLVTNYNQLNSDLERYQSEKNNMVTHRNELKQFVRRNLGEYRRHAERIEEKQRFRLRNLDRILVQKEERNKRELEMLKMVVLRTSIQNPVSSSGSKINPIMVKDE